MSYRVVEEFESGLCAYTGARYAVTTNSCSMAIFLALKWAMDRENFPDTDGDPHIECESRTYCSAAMQIKHAGGYIWWRDEEWRGAYSFDPLPVWDSARRFTSDMYRAGQFQCVSFQTSKILGLEQGGAILHDNEEADTWLRRARFDGRLNAEEKLPKQIGYHCYMSPSVAALGLQRLACLPKHNADQCGYEAFEDISKLPIW